MKALKILMVMALGIVLAMGLVACGGGGGGSDSGTTNSTTCIDINGTWNEHIVQTEVCVGTPTEYDTILTISQTGCSITVTNSDNLAIYTGLIGNDNTFSINISYEENGGTTSGTCEGTISNDANSFNTTCNGQWTNGSYTCNWAEHNTGTRQ